MNRLARILAVCAFACAIVILLPILPALAQAPALSGTSIDFAPLLNQVVVPLAVAILPIVATWLAFKVKIWLGIQNNAALAGVVDSALTNALGYAQSLLAAKIPAGPIPLDVKNEIVAVAANYALGHVPDALKMLGVDQASLVQKLQARLTINTTPPAANIAVVTPPAA